MTRENIVKKIQDILEEPFWPKELTTELEYFRTQDDCDGDLSKGLAVSFSRDGDAWIDTDRECCRFRSFFGGGNSLMVRNALIVLAMAIKLENEKDKQRKP